MNASLPPDDERREERTDEAQPEAAAPQAGRGIGVGTVFSLLLAVGVMAFLMLPLLDYQRVPAQRSTQAELERRQQAIEQAAREASDESRLADHR
jgi:hypothetical protein